MTEFNRRIYHSPVEMIQEINDLMSRYGEIRQLIHEKTLSPAFRERLMLIVTEVNECRYCSYAHAQMALEEDISKEEIRALKQGTLSEFPDEQMPAFLYAQHWAETDGDPDDSARERVIEEYGETVLGQIELAMEMIRTANLLGNTFDYLIYKMSFGRWNPARFMDKLVESYLK
mgnify:CR=1 FL=1